METIWGIEVFPLISLTIFFVFFVVLIIWVLRSDKNEMNSLANIPLDDTNPETQLKKS